MNYTFAAGDRFMRAEFEAQGGSYQRAHLDRAMSHVKQFRTAIDGGAHVGTWAIPMAARFWRVFAFEPSRDTFDALRQNLEAHGQTNVTEFHAALGERSGRARMTIDDPAQVAAGNLGARHIAKGDDVDVVPLDHLALVDVDFIKIDVEGYEPFALRGAKNTLVRCRPVVLFEDKWHWKRYGLPAKAPHDFLLSLGAREIDRVGKDAIWGWAV